MSRPACARPRKELHGRALPSWGTTPAIYVYWFENANSGNSRRYTVDAKSYNHVILFPIFWITDFTASSRSVYKEALTNFLAHSL